MAEKDEHGDHDWFDTLAGRNAINIDVSTAKEAQAVRRAALAATPDEAVQDFDVESGTQKLLFRMRREGLAGATAKRKSWQFYGACALAAVLVLVVGVVMQQPSPVEDTPVYRGDGAQIITTPDTEKLAGALTSELETLGKKPKVTRFGATFTVTTEWPVKPDATHAAFLKRHALKPPAGGTPVLQPQNDQGRF